MRTVVSLALCFALLLSMVPTRALAADGGNGEEPTPAMVNDPVTGVPMPVPTYEPGRGKTLLLATFMGTATGIILGGLLLAFYWNPDADKNYDTMLIATGSIGTLGGLALGLTLPPMASSEDALAGLGVGTDVSLGWKPTVDEAKLWRATLLSFSF